MSNLKRLTAEQTDALLVILKSRFEQQMHRQIDIEWDDVRKKIEAHPDKLWSLSEMERTGGEPDVIGFDKGTDEFVFCDCSVESPVGRRSLCYDKAALEERKENKPMDSALNLAQAMGIEVLNEDDYGGLQKLGKFDTKTSSWIMTPEPIRKLGGALFADYRYGQVFVYHNGAESYYASRGFRGKLKV